MRAGRCAAALGLLLLVLAVPATADAGGWWSFIELGNRYLAPGMEVLSSGTRVSFSSVHEAREARRSGRYYAYLISGFDYRVVREAQSKLDPSRQWWRLGDATAIRLAQVSLGRWEDNLATVRTRFEVPDVSEGLYVLMFCDIGCLRPLADLVPSKVRVVADPLTARIAGGLERMQQRHALERQRLSFRQRQLAARTDAALGRMRTELGAVERRLEGATRRAARPRDPSGPAWWALAGWYLAGLATAMLVTLGVRRRTSSRRTLPGESIGSLVREEAISFMPRSRGRR